MPVTVSHENEYKQSAVAVGRTRRYRTKRGLRHLVSGGRQERNPLLLVPALLFTQLLVHRSPRDDEQIHKHHHAEPNADDRPHPGRHALRISATPVGWCDGVVVAKGVDRCAEAGVDDDLEERECGAERVGAERERRGSCEEAVHDVVWIRCETDEEEKLGALLDRVNGALDGVGGSQPA